MHRKAETKQEKDRRLINNFDHLSKILQTSKAMQRRFTLIPDSALNKVVVAGVRDMNLGLVKDGTPVGANVIRFNNPIPNTKSDYYRICIDPKGMANKANPHIAVSQGTVKAAETIQKGLKVAGKVVLVMSIITTGVRIAKAIYDEVKIDDEIDAWENIVSCLKEDLDDCNKDDKYKMKEIAEALEFAESLLTDARDCKLHPGKKSALTCLCIGGEWCGAMALGYAGAQGGATLGASAGPVGAIVGAVIGGVIGSVTGSVIGAFASSKLGSFISR